MMKRKAATPKPAPSPASFQDEEADFPRGGASSLTPSEVREAREQAEMEFESEGKARSKKKQKKTRPSDELDKAFVGKVPTSVDLLRYKSLSIGMKIWGVILEVGKKDLVVSLPGGLRGFVKAEDASDLFSETYKDRDDSKGIYDVSLFTEGQLVSCVVIKLDDVKLKQNKKRSKRIGLSLRLSSLHNGLTLDAMHEGLVLQAFVTSVEDHGYLVSFGVDGVTGFLRRSAGEAGKLMDSKIKLYL